MPCDSTEENHACINTYQRKSSLVGGQQRYSSSNTVTVSSADKATNFPGIFILDLMTSSFSAENQNRCQQSKPDPPECKVVLQQRATSLLGNVVIYRMQVQEKIRITSQQAYWFGSSSCSSSSWRALHIETCLVVLKLVTDLSAVADKVQFKWEDNFNAHTFDIMLGLHEGHPYSILITLDKIILLMSVWQELEYRIDVCSVTRGAHIEHLQLSKSPLVFLL